MHYSFLLAGDGGMGWGMVVDMGGGRGWGLWGREEMKGSILSGGSRVAFYIHVLHMILTRYKHDIIK